MEILRCLLLPVEGKTLILPHAAVAEIVKFPRAEVFFESKNWVLGEFAWRDLSIPLVCLEMQENHAPFMPKTDLHIAVLNRMFPETVPDFIGIVLQKLPLIQRCKRSDIVFVAEPQVSYLMMEVKLQDQPAFIPNLSWLEKKLAVWQPK